MSPKPPQKISAKKPQDQSSLQSSRSRSHSPSTRDEMETRHSRSITPSKSWASSISRESSMNKSMSPEPLLLRNQKRSEKSSRSRSSPSLLNRSRSRSPIRSTQRPRISRSRSPVHSLNSYGRPRPCSRLNVESTSTLPSLSKRKQRQSLTDSFPMTEERFHRKSPLPSGRNKRPSEESSNNSFKYRRR